MTPALEIEDLNIRFAQAPEPALANFNLRVARGEIVGLVGESGSGKTLAGSSILRLEPAGADFRATRLAVDGVDMLAASAAARQNLRGARAALIFQEPAAALSPVRRIGDQICDVLHRHERLSHRAAREKAVALLADMQIEAPQAVFGRYPFELSGGMCQRVLIAMAFAGRPALIVADEITTAIDAELRVAILDLLLRHARAIGAAIVFISHDLGLVSRICSRVLVLRRGRVVEEGLTAQVLSHPADPYTRMLLAALPDRSPPDTHQPVTEAVA
ncbi:MAG TPA: ABC transporter ATP-binding protein [Rhizomicrobium sp.]